jgi:hypothetical protein
MSLSTRVPILTASPEEATAIVKDTGYVTAHPFQSLLVNIGEQATLTDSGIPHTIDQIAPLLWALAKKAAEVGRAWKTTTASRLCPLSSGLPQ